MANNVLNWVWQHSQSKHASRLVMLALADRARENGVSWPSVAELKRMTGLSDRGVQTAIVDCAKLGELEVGYQQGPKGCNRYCLLMPLTPAESAPPQDLHPAESAPPQSSRGPESESSQFNAQDPADSAPPENSAHPADPAPHPADSAGGTLKEPSPNSPTESSEGGAGGDPGDALFDAPPAKPRRARRKTSALGEVFDRFYAAYPLHKDRGDAEKAWPGAIADTDPEVLIAAALAYHNDPQVKRGYAKHPGRWLRAKCWLDEAAPPTNGDAHGNSRPTNYTDEEYNNGWGRSA